MSVPSWCRTAVALAFVLAPTAVSSLAAQTATAPAPATRSRAVAVDSIDRFMRAEMERAHIPGVALAVVRGGRVVTLRGYGTADVEHGVAVTPKSVFKVGSLSKQFLAAGILLLEQDGLLRVDDPVSRHIPGTPETWRGVTLRHLLTHTAGLVREGPAFDPLKVQPDSVVIASAFSVPLVFPTGTQHQYCNICYFTLAEVIARRSGKPWEQFFAERVFGPLGMTDTRGTTTREVVPRRARGYAWEKDRYVNAEDYRAMRPSGAFLSTLDDLVKWDAALDDGRLLRKQSLDAMWTPATLVNGTRVPYGFGWRLDSLDGRPRVHHGGSLPGFRAEYARFPSDSLAVIVLTNGDGANPMAISQSVARIYWSGSRR